MHNYNTSNGGFLNRDLWSTRSWKWSLRHRLYKLSFLSFFNEISGLVKAMQPKWYYVSALYQETFQNPLICGQDGHIQIKFQYLIEVMDFSLTGGKFLFLTLSIFHIFAKEYEKDIEGLFI